MNNRVVYIPIPRIVATSPRGVDAGGRTWERVVSLTRQPGVGAASLVPPPPKPSTAAQQSPASPDAASGTVPEKENSDSGTGDA